MSWHQYDNERRLPWKNEKDPYKIWLSEIILQQTRAAQGLSYYNNFVTRFPTIGDLAKADENLIFKLWEGLGYYNRCRNLIATAKFIHEKRKDVFPETYEDILALKGVGPYTAAAIASFAFGLPHAVVDGNVTRVLSRFFGIALAMDTAEGKRMIRELADMLIDNENPSDYNQAIMDFGATVCKPADPQCVECPLQLHCVAYNKGMIRQLPNKSKATAVRTRTFNFLIVKHENHVFIRQRKRRDIWRSLFEFPQIETKELLTKQQIMRNAELKVLFDNGQSHINKISSPVRQRLTHQLIIAQFIHINTSKRPENFMDAVPVEHNELKNFAFPKIVAKYLFEL